jgi:hypothetical protein
MKLETVEEVGTKARGKKELIAHLYGERLTARQAGLAKCYECMGAYADGRGQDCEIPDCPLYPFMPYSSKPREKRVISDKQMARVSKGIRKTA